MVNSNANALGILFPNSYDFLVPDLVGERLMASIPFASRYRLVDFILSSMVNCGIDNISVIVRKNYHSLMDHLGSGREWDLTRKNGGLNLVPPFAEKTVKIYNGRVEALASILDFLKEQKERYVVMADTNLAVNFDFKALINAHMESGADVTIAYQESELPKSFMEAQNIGTSFYYTLGIEDGHVTKMKINACDAGIQNFSMNIYIMDRELLIDQINTAFVRGYVYFERDILAPQLNRLDVRAYRYDGYVGNHRYSALCDAAHGAAVLNDCKYGISMNGNRLELTLLRAPSAPEMRADNRVHTFTYAFTAWEGSFADCDVVRQGYELNVPALVMPGSTSRFSQIQIDRENILLDTMKPAEDGSGDIILRLYESKKAAVPVRIHTEFQGYRPYLCDMLENIAEEIPSENGDIQLSFRAFEVKTIRLVKN